MSNQPQSDDMAPPPRPSRSRKNRFIDAPFLLPQSSDSATDNGTDGTGSQPQSLRSMNMNLYGSQPGSRQPSRLQNTQKTGLGNGNAGAGWAFGAPSAGGFGGLGAAPGLGQSRPGQLSGFAQVMGGGGQPQIDLSDFPSLSGAPRQQQTNNSNWNSAAVRQPIAQQPQQPPSQAPSQQQQQQRAPSTAPSHQSIDQFDGQRPQQPADRGLGGEEYSSLSGPAQINGDIHRQPSGFGSAALRSPDDQHPQPSGQQTQLPIRDASNNNFPPNQQAPIGSSQPSSQPQSQTPQGQSSQSAQPSQPTPGVKPYSEMTEQEKWGLPGLIALFEARRQVETGGQIDPTLPNADANAVLMMGQDLSNLGMDLDSPEPIGPTFSVWHDNNGAGSVFDFKDRHPVPHFNVPQAYMVNNVPPMHGRMGAFSDETLFQIFFTQPGDLHQELAAGELALRDWRWHKVLRLWLQKDTREANQGTATPPLIDLTNNAPIGQNPVLIDEHHESGVYIFFNHLQWRRERRTHTLQYSQLHNNTPLNLQQAGVTQLRQPSAAPVGGMPPGVPPGNPGGGQPERQPERQTSARPVDP